ncbi:MAG: TolC family protein, partial [Myxococcales bacterium]|nr:TolC family protein [Myxococcales bacterium]
MRLGLPWALMPTLLACSPHAAQKPDAIGAGAAQLPDGYSAAAGEGASSAPRFWTEFGDPGLDNWMARVEASNLGLRGAFARLDRARALAEVAGAGQWPTLDASLTASRSRSAFFGAPREFSQYQVGLAAAYEVDVWGRVSSAKQAAVLDAEAARFDVAALAITLAAETSEAWFELA